MLIYSSLSLRQPYSSPSQSANPSLPQGLMSSCRPLTRSAQLKCCQAATHDSGHALWSGDVWFQSLPTSNTMSSKSNRSRRCSCERLLPPLYVYMNVCRSNSSDSRLLSSCKGGREGDTWGDSGVEAELLSANNKEKKKLVKMGNFCLFTVFWQCVTFSFWIHSQ